MNGSTPVRMKLGGKCECHDCGLLFGDDIYIWEGDYPRGEVYVCGDCRYVRRHKKLPPKRPREQPSPNKTERGYHGGYGSETLNRFSEYECSTEREAARLNEILRDSTISLD